MSVLLALAREGATEILDSLKDFGKDFEEICEKNGIEPEVVNLRLAELIQDGLININPESREEETYKLTEKGEKATNIYKKFKKI